MALALSRCRYAASAAYSGVSQHTHRLFAGLAISAASADLWAKQQLIVELDNNINRFYNIKYQIEIIIIFIFKEELP